MGIIDPREYAALPADIRLFWKVWYNKKMDRLNTKKDQKNKGAK
jgi:hypothetical protein